MKQCTDQERTFLDLLIGQPEVPSENTGKRIVKIMERIRTGNDIEKQNVNLAEIEKSMIYVREFCKDAQCIECPIYISCQIHERFPNRWEMKE